MADPFDTSLAPTTEPENIILGKYVSWRRELAYTDTVKYVFRSLTGNETSVELVGTLSGDYWIFEAIGSVTGAWQGGEYAWDMVVVRTSDSEEIVVETGFINFFANTDDRRTHAEIMLAKIESVLSGRADNDVETYSIKSRSITKMSIKELTSWRNYYISEINRTGGSVVRSDQPKNNTVRVRFI